MFALNLNTSASEMGCTLAYDAEGQIPTISDSSGSRLMRPTYVLVQLSRTMADTAWSAHAILIRGYLVDEAGNVFPDSAAHRSIDREHIDASIGLPDWLELLIARAKEQAPSSASTTG